MKELNLQLIGGSLVGFPVVTIDGEPVKLKKEKGDKFSCHYETQKDSVKIELFRCIDSGGALWFLLQLFFFLISVFGLFDLHRRERSLVPCFALEANLEEKTDITLRCRVPKVKAEAATVKASCETTTLYNEYVVDQKTKKLYKALTITKLFLALAVIALIIAAVVLHWF